MDLISRAVSTAIVGLAISLLSCTAMHAQEIAFTFDDLPAHGELPPGETRLDVAQSILATLAANHMPPTYGMVNGVRTVESPSSIEVLKAWRAAGQPLGNHGWSHLSVNDHTAEGFEADIAKNEPLLQSLMPSDDWHWFRYPFLLEGDTLEKRHAVRSYLFAHGYKIAQVNLDFGDYLWNSPYARCMAKGGADSAKSVEWLHSSYVAAVDQYLTLFRNLSQQVYGREIPYVLLLHIGAFDAKMLPDLIALYRSKGFRFVSLPEAEKDPAYQDDPDLALAHGGPLLEQMMAAKKLKFPPSTRFDKELDAVCR